ncbi:MAG: ThuA domain-containing protein [Bacteroidales bacterium]|nr:ThuA domain-containing protein [Bacteroidales bacterium]
MLRVNKTQILTIAFCLFCSCQFSSGIGKNHNPKFKVIAFYSAKNDKAHISYVHEANRWFSKIAPKYNFVYDSTNNWDNMNPDFLSGYQVVVFLDTRPDSSCQRVAFKKYIENGGAWMGFHFCAFALTPSAYPQNWDWYHNQFLGSGQYAGNTWAPTTAVLRVEDRQHPATKNLPETFTASPNEWYKWEKDLRENPDIKILVSIDSTSFPLGTGPKLHEIWHNGYYPMVWANKNYKMLYINMGHNIIDYDNHTNKELSFTFNNEIQNKLVIDGLMWLGGRK